MTEWLGKLAGGNGPKRTHVLRWLIILGLLGVAIMLLNSFVNVKKIDPENVGREPPGTLAPAEQASTASSGGGGDSSFASIENAFESSMKQMLEQIVGVGTVDVMVTVDSTEEIVVQRNVKDSQEQTEESDSNGGKRNSTQFTRDGEIVTYESSGSQTPIVTKRIKPKVRGVLVVAKGAENPVVKQLIVDAVEKGLNVPAYRVSVVPRKQQ
ncbi:stage III sporulation protein AG [Paenibacillus sp. JX-17]|uniref:Stage III sporulation protein AG n=1 Tax=Paenibacillus lacisoli TaxID=3064525 RepID=A0ABT9C925_9BACL|nr:stage III sporulation protein AG [Paenibacillus sp. JX-17]MDO7905169.1 stage III sporulation protein AG [Paenibacillus sp. JX-17]